MKRLGESRIEALSLRIADQLGAAAGVEIRNRGALVSALAAALRDSFGADNELDARVRARIASLSRPVVEGSREWEVLYRQYREELSRRR